MHFFFLQFILFVTAVILKKTLTCSRGSQPEAGFDRWKSPLGMQSHSWLQLSEQQTSSENRQKQYNTIRSITQTELYITIYTACVSNYY